MAKGHVRLVQGERSRDKVVVIEGVEESDVLALLPDALLRET